MTPFEELYGRRCSSMVWLFEVCEYSHHCPEIICEALEKVRVINARLKTASRLPKSYDKNGRTDLEFKVDDMVYLKISPMKGVMRF